MTNQSQKNVGEIITFYSYKGGTGRTMSLANVACLMTKRLLPDERILVIDWDMEAPGLHYYFRQHIIYDRHGYSTSNQAFTEHPGLIELFLTFKETFKGSDFSSVNEEKLSQIVQDIALEDFVLETDIKGLYLLKAGQFNDDYSTKVNQFDWLGFYNRAPSLFKLLAGRLSDTYKYVLIDSRTGVTDTSGICTALMPSKLVTVFTPNNQSLSGVINTIEKVASYRLQSDDLRPLSIFPLPSRVETSEEELKDIWRFGSSHTVTENSSSGSLNVVGYQQRFQDAFKKVYNLASCDLDDYFDEMQVQHFPRYSYGEELAVIRDKDSDRLSLSQSYKIFANHLLSKHANPWNYVKSSGTRVFDDGSDNIRKNREFDIFLCHNSKDKPAVIKIAEHLRRKGLNPWLDVWELQPGAIWQFSLEKQIENIGAVAVFVGDGGLGPWQDEEIYALLQEFIRRSRPIIPVVLPGALNVPRLPIFLRNRHWVDFRLSQPDPMDQLVWGATGQRPNLEEVT